MKKNKDHQTSEEKEINKESQQAVTDETTPQTASTEPGEVNSTEEAAGQNAADIEALNTEISDLKDKNLRLMAEFDNFRRRSAKEKMDLIKTAGEDLLVRILPLVDDFERAMKAMENSSDAQAVKEGIDLIYSKFLTFLKDNGVEAIPTENEVFNTDLHEAVTTFPAPSDEQKGKIIDCLTRGYLLNEKVIRFAKVVVGE
jgi:molecular chaperone GrpE